ncbi:hypothetical protein [Polluticaenibacter yanchengensis]|uniref:Uncharacterized protein n=1 Tax=Polluticaenibacter yanchengensis TaxID=3014562 RepID=A0ABT4UQH3_9BACT|nr:hypothetical protein [Chitinophagaceae bacterium LY-5]
MRKGLLVLFCIFSTSIAIAQKDSVDNGDGLDLFINKIHKKSNDFIEQSERSYNTYINKVNKKWAKKILPLSKKMNLDFADSLLDKNKLSALAVKKNEYVPLIDSLNVFTEYLDVNKSGSKLLAPYKGKLDSIQLILGGSDHTIKTVSKELREAVLKLDNLENVSKKDYKQFLKSLKSIEKINTGYLNKYNKQLGQLKKVSQLQSEYLSKANLEKAFKHYFERNNLLAKTFGIVKKENSASLGNMIKGVQDRVSLKESLPDLLSESVLKNDFLKSNLSKVNSTYRNIDATIKEITKKDSTGTHKNTEDRQEDSNEQNAKKLTFSIVAPLLNKTFGRSASFSTLGVMMSYKLTKKINAGMMLEHQYTLNSKDFKFVYDYKGFSGAWFIESKFINEKKKHNLLKNIWFRTELELNTRQLSFQQAGGTDTNTHKKVQTNLNLGVRKGVTFLNRSFSIMLMYNCNEFNTDWFNKERLHFKMACSL